MPVKPYESGPGHHGHRRKRIRKHRLSHVRRRTEKANRIPKPLPPHPEDQAAPQQPPLMPMKPTPWAPPTPATPGMPVTIGPFTPPR